MNDFDRAEALLQQFKGSTYLHGANVLDAVGERVAAAGATATLVRGTFPGSDGYVAQIRQSLSRAGVHLVAETKGARPNAPCEDLFRIADELTAAGAEVLISFGGGSTIDAAKAADVLRVLGGSIDDYFGVGAVTEALNRHGRELSPHVSIQTVASSAAHLTKYSNITDLAGGQKKLIVDDAIVPNRPVFDYAVTKSTPAELTADGALDGMSHCLEVLYGAVNKPHYEKAAEIADVSIRLMLEHLPRVLADGNDYRARRALCLATDLGGYSIMIGGTNGGHLTSFSLVDILPHGRACAIMNPYYTVFFAPAIEGPLRLVGKAYRQAGFTQADVETLAGRDLGAAVADAMFAFAREVGFPTTLGQVRGFGDTHIERALTAAKNPQLRMKLQNMPIPLTAEMIDEYMGPVLRAAREGDLSVIRNV